ncbi:trypsin-like peptidase domain-containing protein [Longispora sp. NPDC051575]|uniref:trypsin-like serine peptidase n=1 Tax=Longispora sp. NPDC051575 TaxID=3154943 RepID=UPI0034444F8E
MVQRHRRPTRLPRARFALVAATVLVAAAAAWAVFPGSAVPTAAPPPPGPPGVVTPVPLGEPAVGALFGAAGERGCTASVVHSPGRNLVLTAAHCVTGDDMFFAPGYHDGQRPSGTWQVVDRILDDRWDSDGDPDYDLAFLLVRDADGDRLVEDVAGAHELATEGPFDQPVRMTGYPAGLDHPISCDGLSQRWEDTQLRIACAGFTDGTSGGPWVTASGAVVGLIGGYEQGGGTADISYSPYFGEGVAALYRRATGGAR